VKSSSRPKDYHFDDIALQAVVREGAGVAVSSIELLHVNTAYVRGLGGICWADFFARVDVRDAVAARLVDLPSRLPAMRDCRGMVELPGAEPRSQCETPFACEFLDRCMAGKPADWIGYLPLSIMGINAIPIPVAVPQTNAVSGTEAWLVLRATD
jgi:hypothetical protein